MDKNNSIQLFEDRKIRTADTLLPCVYDDFIGTAKKSLHKNIVRGYGNCLNSNSRKIQDTIYRISG